MIFYRLQNTSLNRLSILTGRLFQVLNVYIDTYSKHIFSTMYSFTFIELFVRGLDPIRSELKG